MSHVRLWRFMVPPAREERFIDAYGPQGEWAELFREARGFLRVELWRAEDGSFLTADHWQSGTDFERFQANLGPRYHALDAKFQGLASKEIFIGAFDTV